MNYSIINNFQIESSEETLDEDTLHEALTDRIAEMLQYETDLLFSTLYRLDVLEHKIKHVLSGVSGEDIPGGLARLVIERQKEKLATRKNTGEPPQFKDF